MAFGFDSINNSHYSFNNSYKFKQAFKIIKGGSVSNTKRDNKYRNEVNHAIKHGLIDHNHELFGKPIRKFQDHFNYNKEYSKTFLKGQNKEINDYRQMLSTLGVKWDEVEEGNKASYDFKVHQIVYSKKTLRFEVKNNNEPTVVGYYSEYCVDPKHFDSETGTDKRDGLEVACRPNPAFIGRCPCSSCSSFNVRFKKQEARKERQNKLKEANFGF